MKTVMMVFGTRPEAIKMAPVVRAINETPGLFGTVCVTAQHRGMLDQVLDLFQITPVHDLDIMTPSQKIWDVTTRVVNGLVHVFERFKPDMVLVHGDTSTTFGAALAAFYRQIPVGHVEAGLRTHNPYSPFPEEINRRLVGGIACQHFAPTLSAVSNLLNEGVDPDTIHLTGNTAIDALLQVTAMGHDFPELAKMIGDGPMVLITAHRRENFGAPLKRVVEAVRTFAEQHPEFKIVYPVHPNPSAKLPAYSALQQCTNVHLIDPVGYEEMAWLMKRSQFILTDSGGIQEEAPSLGKPVLILRETTERPEAVTSGAAVLVGTDGAKILQMMNALVDKESAIYQQMSEATNPFGDGTAARRIADAVACYLGMSKRVPDEDFLPTPILSRPPGRASLGLM